MTTDLRVTYLALTSAGRLIASSQKWDSAEQATDAAEAHAATKGETITSIELLRGP